LKQGLARGGFRGFLIGPIPSSQGGKQWTLVGIGKSALPSSTRFPKRRGMGEYGEIDHGFHRGKPIMMAWTENIAP
jgi:hypothetical protein